MLEKIKYVNNRGDTMHFGESGIYVNENDLRDWEWSFSTDYGKIRNFSRKSASKTLPVEIWAADEESALEIKNRLHDVTTADIVDGTPGRLYIGDYYMTCYVTASKKSNYLTSKNILSVSLKVSASSQVWYKESKFWFGDREGLKSDIVGKAIVGYAEVGSSSSSDDSIVYDYDYPRAYETSIDARYTSVVNESLTPCEFLLEISGHAANPEIIVGNDMHRVNFTIETGQTIVVDSRDRTVKAITSSGSINLFRYRDKTEDIFKLIPPGASNISWNGDYIFTITLYQERSEPLWT